MKILNALIVLLSFVLMTFVACDKDDETKAALENRLIGTWKFQSSTDNYWYQLEFKSDMTGTRTDADNENTNFTYSFTSTELNFVSGFPSGKYEYSISVNKLSLFDNELTKQ